MTPIQILIPLTDVLFIIFAIIDVFKQVQIKRNDGLVASHNKLKLGQISISLVGSSFCLIAYGKDGGQHSFPIREALMHRLKIRMVPFKNTAKHAKVLMEMLMDIVALFFMPLSYITFKGLLCED